MWPEESRTDLKELKNRIHSHVRTLRANGIDFLSKGTHGGYILQGDVVEEAIGRNDENVPFSGLMRFKDLIYASAMASILTLAVTALARGFVTSFGVALTQPPQFGFVSGVFQAVFGSLAWSVPLSLVLLQELIFRENFGEWRSELRLLPLIGWGAAAGIIGGICVDIALMFAQQKETLYEAGWIQSQTASPWSAFSVTKVAYAEPALGLAVGSCCAVVMWLSLRESHWKNLSAAATRIHSFTELGLLIDLVFREIFIVSILLIEVPVIATGAIACFAIDGHISLSRFVGESFVIGTAGVAFSIGLLASICILGQKSRPTSRGVVGHMR
jgi:hypothetical protein